jgi:DNA-binding NarL/FixJ family response regulator
MSTNGSERNEGANTLARSAKLRAQLSTAVVLDRDAIWQEAIEQVLRRLDITVVGKAALPNRALALVDECKPDLLIIEIETCDSEIDGIESLRRARTRVPQLTTIALSVSDDPEQIAAAFDAGASAYVSKKTQPDDFLMAIRQLFEKSIFFAGDRRGQAPNREVRLLSPRELDVLRIVAEGRSNAEVAKTLWVTEQTVKFHLRNIYRKLGVSNRTEASNWAHAHRLFLENGGENAKGKPEREPDVRRSEISE